MIYLDYAATSPLRARAFDAMLPYLQQDFGNASAAYSIARQAQKAIDDARRAVGEVLGCRTSDIVFTSGGTESINTALKGVAFAMRKSGAGNHLVTTEVEHDAVLHTCNYLEQFGFEVTTLPVDGLGRIDPEAVAKAVNDRTVLVSVMQANNEVGTVQPIAEITSVVAQRARALGKRIPVHSDSVQAPGALPLRVDELAIDLLSLSGHKFGGPKGSGVLYVRRGIPFVSQVTGGGQERQRRAGTENVAAIVGQAVALTDAEEQRPAYIESTRRLRDRLIEALTERIPDSLLTGDLVDRLSSNLSISFRGVRGDELVRALDREGIAASAGAACGSSTWEPSHVLLAMGLSMPDVVGGLRLSLSLDTTDAEVDQVIAILPRVIQQLRPIAAAG